jgi:hypothetical protein
MAAWRVGWPGLDSIGLKSTTKPLIQPSRTPLYFPTQSPTTNKPTNHTNTDGIRGRTCSSVIALLELLAFLAPVSIIAYVPRFFFGGLLVLIALDLILEWLFHSRRKMMGAEYGVALATFLAIGLTNIELGWVCRACVCKCASVWVLF